MSSSACLEKDFSLSGIKLAQRLPKHSTALPGIRLTGEGWLTAVPVAGGGYGKRRDPFGPRVG